MSDNSALPIAVLQALLVPAVAVVGTWIASQQLWIAREKARYDAFDRRWERRFAVYEATRQFLGDVFDDMSEEKIRLYGLIALETKFLFDDKMYDYLREVLSRVTLWHNAKNKAALERHDEDARRAYKAIENENLSWIIQQGDERFNEIFKPFLVLERSVSSCQQWGGPFRIWIIVSSIWSIAVFQDPVWWDHWTEHSEPYPRDWLSLLLVLLLPWILTTAGFSIWWVVRGFRAK